MAKVSCYECNKTYDYYEDGFCPRCGCFNQPPRQSRIDANGDIVYHEGINEKTHTGSFVHKEYHAENRKRAFTKLEAKPGTRPQVKVHIPSSQNSKEAFSLVKLIIYGFALLVFMMLQIAS